MPPGRPHPYPAFRKKYVSDKQKADPDSLIDAPCGSFDDMLALKARQTLARHDKISSPRLMTWSMPSTLQR